MTSEQNEGRMLPFNIQFFAEGGAEGGAANGAEGGNAEGGNNAQNGAAGAAAQNQTANVLSSEEIQKMIQATVDKQTADLGKTISELKKENAQLKKANMTAEEIQKAEREEFEAQKAEVELQKRQIYAHKAVAAAGYGDNAEAVVDIVLGNTDDITNDRLQKFKSLVDKLVAETVQQKFKANGRVPSGGTTGGEEKKENGFAAELGKKAAETAKRSNEILNHYYGGKN